MHLFSPPESILLRLFHSCTNTSRDCINSFNNIPYSSIQHANIILLLKLAILLVRETLDIGSSNNTSRVRKKNGGHLAGAHDRRSGDKRRCTVKVIT